MQSLKRSVICYSGSKMVSFYPPLDYKRQQEKKKSLLLYIQLSRCCFSPLLYFSSFFPRAAFTAVISLLTFQAEPFTPAENREAKHRWESHGCPDDDYSPKLCLIKWHKRGQLCVVKGALEEGKKCLRLLHKTCLAQAIKSHV